MSIEKRANAYGTLRPERFDHAVAKPGFTAESLCNCDKVITNGVPVNATFTRQR